MLRGKELSPGQMDIVINSENSNNLLFLKVVLEVSTFCLCLFSRFFLLMFHITIYNLLFCYLNKIFSLG